MPMPEDRLTSAFGRSTREANMSEAKSAREKYRAVLVDALRDAEFRRRFVADPEAVLAEHGVEAPRGVTIKVVENTPELVHVVLPPLTADGELSDAELETAAGGANAATPRPPTPWDVG